MGVIFSTAPGRVAVLDSGQGALPFRVSLTGWGGYQQRKAIITQASVEQIGNYQFLHTVSDFIHVYVFGDRIGELRVSGIAFAADCNTQAGDDGGIENALDYYENYRIAAQGAPVKISLGRRPFQGFLTRGRVDVLNAETALGQFTWSFNVFPESKAAALPATGGPLSPGANAATIV